MRKSWLVLLGCGLMLILFAAGCDEDECMSCPDDPVVTPLGFTDGSLSLAPSAMLTECHVYGYGAVAPNLDSVMVGDSAVPKSDWEIVFMPSPAGIHWKLNFIEDGIPSTFMYEHGDVATVRMWGNGRSGACQLKVLHPEPGRANITSPAPFEDTIASHESDTIYWNTVEHADYYAVTLGYTPVGGTFAYYFDYTVDTSFVVTGTMQGNPLTQVGIAVTPFTGPDPRSGASNWTGNLLSGAIYSFGYWDEITIYVEHSVTAPPSGRSPAEVTRPEMTPAEMVGRVYEKYRP
jgi:hypothetical protein